MRYISGYSSGTYIFKICKSEEKHNINMQSGYNHIYIRDGFLPRLYTFDGYFDLPETAEQILQNYYEDDVLTIYENGIITQEYNTKSHDNALVTTLRCNSNCVMCPCSENSRRNADISSFYEIKEKLRYFPREMGFLTITGGEPTLLKEDFFRLLKVLQLNFPKTQFQLLTNGRAFSDYSFTHRFIENIPDNIYTGIPLYGFDEVSHDTITQSKGSFKQTVVGIHNLLHFDIDIEIRVVLSRLNIDNISKIAKYIIKYFPRVHSVKFMGLEMLGNAVKNKELVWMPYDEIAKKAEEAINLLVFNGIDVQLFNFPLCSVRESYWQLCSKSISDYKISFFDKCETCEVKELCGGIFCSTLRNSDFLPNPVRSSK